MPSPSLSALLREDLGIAQEYGAAPLVLTDLTRFITLAETIEADARLLADALGNVLGGFPTRVLDQASINAAVERRRSREGA